MSRVLREFTAFLREQPLWWLLPIAAYFGALALVAWLHSAQPDSPFLYQVF